MAALPLLRGTTEYADCENCPFSKNGRPSNPVFSEYPEDPDFLLVGDLPGGAETRFRKPFCLVPETLVLMADLRWKPLDDVSIGDKIITIEEEGAVQEKGASGRKSRRWLTAVVTNKIERRAPTFEVITNKGHLCGTRDHRVLVGEINDKLRKGTKHWRRIDQLITPKNIKRRDSKESHICFIGTPWEQNHSYAAAYLAGFYDGEGSVSGSRGGTKAGTIVNFAQNAGETEERVISYLNSLGYTPRKNAEQKTNGIVCNHYIIPGGFTAVARFLGTIRPERLISNFINVIESGHKPLAARFEKNSYGKVISIAQSGTRRVIDITTTSGTFIANGFVVHNCGETGKVVNKMLAAVGQPRDRVFISNALLCQPTKDDPRLKEQAARACSMRLKMELRRFPNKPLFILGALAARSIIPKEALDAIDPPDVLPSHKKKAKDKQESLDKAQKARDAKQEKLTSKLIRQYIRQWHINRRIKPKRDAYDIMAKFHAEDLAAIEQRVSAEVQAELTRLDEEALKKQQTRKKTKQLGISDIAGTCFKVDVDGTGERIVIPTINPASILKGGGKALLGSHTPDLAFFNVVSDAAKIKAIVAGKDIFLSFPGEIEFQDEAKTEELFYRFYRRAVEEKCFALDLETYVDDTERHHALQAFMAKIRAVGLAVNDWSISFLWELLPQRCKDLLRVLLGDPKIRKVFHNGLYDRTVLRAQSYVCSTEEWDDSLLQHHNAFPGAAHNLQSVTAQFFAVEPWKSEFRNNEETPEKLVSYCRKDTHSTKQIHNALTVWIKRTQTERSYALDKKMSEIASQMHLQGVPVDQDENQELLKQFMIARDASRQAVETLASEPETLKYIKHLLSMEQAKTRRKADPESFRERQEIRLGEISKKESRGKWHWKVSANQHVAALLRAQGVELNAVTDKGATKVNKEILESLVEVPIVRDILRYRENDKLISTFVWPLFDRTLADGTMSYGFADPNNRVHPIWSVHKITGRWASGDPVVSNIPKAKIKKHPDGRIEILRPNIRRQYVARKGRIFVGFDFGQLEARILALLSRDQFLCDVFSAGKDIHTEAARIIWPEFDSLDPKMQKQTRDRAKPFEYGAFYGADPETLYKNLLKEGFPISRADVYKAYNALMNKLQGVMRYQTNIVDFAAQPPFTLSTFLTKRRRIFPLGQVDRNECLNWPIQAAGADIMNTGMGIMWEKLPKYNWAFPILQIHDAAVFECWEDDAERLLEDVKDSFIQEYTIDGVTVKFPIDAKISKSWADQ